MTPEQQPRPRARIAEARRNRTTLLDTAARLFAEGSGPVALETIAREAGVGIGTLYRHFPTREALVEAITLDQVAQLHETAAQLLDSAVPLVAMRRWTTSFAQWARTKHGMLDTLSKILASGTLDSGSLRGELTGAVELFLQAGHRDGSMRGDVSADDVASLLAATLVSHSAVDQPQLERRLQLIVDILRPL